MNTIAKFLVVAAAFGSAGLGQAAQHFAVKVTGRGRPVLLIPGLSCGPEVWDATVERLKNRYECHVLTLPGFAGQPAMSGPFLQPLRDEIISYVRKKGLRQPAVVGHSLGGFMAFSLASTQPDLFGPVVGVDGAPWLMALFNPNATVDSIRPQVEAMTKGMAASSGSKEAVKASTRAYLAAQIKDPKRVERTLEVCIRSDPATVSKAMAEMMLTDLRPAAAKITSPVLLMAAGDWAKTLEQREMIRRGYRAQIANVKNGRMIPFWGARHFIMFDEPVLFHRELERFLEESWPKR